MSKLSYNVRMSKHPHIYLASQSPRRAALLKQIHINFVPLRIHMAETIEPGDTPAAYVKRMALDKATMGWHDAQRTLPCPVLGADTIVVLGNEILTKPRDSAHALAMLQQLSNQTHLVMTAVALVDAQQSRVSLCTSKVSFRELSQSEITAYWETGEPYDKAGAYAIQGVAASFITHLEGSYSGVMGLPLYETFLLLKEFGVIKIP